MATAIAATPQAATSTAPPSMLLQVTGAPNPPANAYASNFATVDGWATSGTGNTLTQTTVSGVNVIRLLVSPGPGTGTRTVTGLTIGAQYKVSILFLTSAGQTRLGVQGIGATAWVSGGTLGFMGVPPTYATLTYTFTATATSHIITLEAQKTTGSTGSVYVKTATVQPSGTWLGTTIYRTDANGTDIPVREDVGGQDVAGTTMTLTDWEAALIGTVTYRVVDGLGASATVATTHGATENPAHGAWLTLPATATPSTGAAGAPKCVQLPLVLRYDAAAESIGTMHQVIGRTDKIGNPGPLSTRTGTLDIFQLDYPATKALRTLLANGDTAMLRQPKHAGLDAYLVATRVAEGPDPAETINQRWHSVVDFEEQVAP